MTQDPKAGSKPAHILGGRGLAAVMATLFVAGGLIGQYGMPFPARPTASIADSASPGNSSQTQEATASAIPETALEGGASQVVESREPEPAVEVASENAPAAVTADVTGMANVDAPAPAMSTPTLAAPRLVPMPVRRPAEFNPSRLVEIPKPRRRVAAVPVPGQAIPQKEDERSFVEKLFGIDLSSKPTPAPALAYASLETNGAADRSFRQKLSALPPSVPAPVPQVPSLIGIGGVAVYDIRAQVVTLPNGEKLEAHSGLGDIMDNPAHVHVPMRGPTPIGTYELTERERLFHGVRAIRLNPVGGSEAVHGRVGLLAHTFMLGPKGASNGCVSFRNYERFLQAYLTGQVRRLVVVAGG